jgi:uncharacterized protein (DUF3820 family)
MGANPTPRNGISKIIDLAPERALIWFVQKGVFCGIFRQIMNAIQIA